MKEHILKMDSPKIIECQQEILKGNAVIRSWKIGSIHITFSCWGIGNYLKIESDGESNYAALIYDPSLEKWHFLAMQDHKRYETIKINI